jgi:integrase
VHVRRSWVRGHEDTPKSHKVRSVPLIDQAARALDELSRREHFTDDDDRVFANGVGDVLGQDLLRRRFMKAVKAAGLPALRLHDLRHTFGTLAVQAFPLSDVKAYMGHANIETTMIYVHHVPQHDAADKLTALVAASENALTGARQ